MVAVCRSDIVTWLAKLREVSNFLTLWLAAQTLWAELEVVESLSVPLKQLSGIQRDLNKFAALAKDMGNIMQASVSVSLMWYFFR
jgi:uncharacterized protein (DUF2147 family)